MPGTERYTRLELYRSGKVVDLVSKGSNARVVEGESGERG